MNKNKLASLFNRNSLLYILTFAVVLLSLQVFFPDVSRTIFGSSLTSYNSGASLKSANLSSKSETSNANYDHTKSIFSILVNNTDYTLGSLRNKVEELEGEVLSWDNNRGTIDQIAELLIRLPKDNFETFAGFLRSESIRVVSENIKNTSYTENAYENLDEKIEKLQSTINTLEDIKTKTEDSVKVMNVQRQIDTVQEDIEAFKARKDFLDLELNTILVQVNLTTDEQALPYLPSDPWSPETVFKKAVRSLLISAQKIGTAAIWLFVYSPIILGVLTILVTLRNLYLRFKR
ncbi:DUF4349 domain-containing protein [Patescibacteria group bacterium]|nr:DUF4349 domain-containing protein [Patescibacteria group bacterium]